MSVRSPAIKDPSLDVNRNVDRRGISLNYMYM